MQCYILVNTRDFGRNNKVGLSNRAIVAFYDSDGVIGLYRDDFDLNAHRVCLLGELLARKLPSGVHNELIGRA